MNTLSKKEYLNKNGPNKVHVIRLAKALTQKYKLMTLKRDKTHANYNDLLG